MGLELAHGGHLTHGMKINVSGKALRHRDLPGRSRDEPDRHGRGRARSRRERRPKMIVAGWSAYPRQLDFARFREIADEVGALPDGRHGPLRRPGRGRPAPEPGAVRRRRHDDDPQDDRRSARGHDPVPRGVRQEDQLGRLPRPAGRPARARDRRQGGGAAGSPRPTRSASARSAPSTVPERSPRRCSAPAAGVSVLTGGTDVHLVLVDLRESAARRPAGRGPPASTSGSPSTATRSRSTRARRWSPPGCGSARRRWPRAGLQAEDFVEIGEILAAALQPGDFEARRGELSERAAAIADRYPLYAGLRHRVVA